MSASAVSSSVASYQPLGLAGLNPITGPIELEGKLALQLIASAIQAAPTLATIPGQQVGSLIDTQA